MTEIELFEFNEALNDVNSGTLYSSAYEEPSSTPLGPCPLTNQAVIIFSSGVEELGDTYGYTPLTIRACSTLLGVS